MGFERVFGLWITGMSSRDRDRTDNRDGPPNDQERDPTTNHCCVLPRPAPRPTSRPLRYTVHCGLVVSAVASVVFAEFFVRVPLRPRRAGLV
jgi:hypothetical protein